MCGAPFMTAPTSLLLRVSIPVLIAFISTLALSCYFKDFSCIQKQHSGAKTNYCSRIPASPLHRLPASLRVDRVAARRRPHAVVRVLVERQLLRRRARVERDAAVPQLLLFRAGVDAETRDICRAQAAVDRGARRGGGAGGGGVRARLSVGSCWGIC
jgi:hypothetical protein